MICNLGSDLKSACSPVLGRKCLFGISEHFRKTETASEKLNVYNSEKRDAISFLKDSFPGNFPAIDIIPSLKQK
jgi:hypothetical protein